MRNTYYLIIILLSTCSMHASTHNKVYTSSFIASEKKNMQQVPMLSPMQETERIQRAWISSFIIPGLGQIYNKHYWKVFVIYVGFFLFGRNAYNQHNELIKYKKNLREYEKGLLQHKNKAMLEKGRRDATRVRALYIILASAWYIINILDAYAGAHMRTFNLSKHIDFVILPEMQTSTSQKVHVGLNVTWHIR